MFDLPCFEEKRKGGNFAWEGWEKNLTQTGWGETNPYVGSGSQEIGGDGGAGRLRYVSTEWSRRRMYKRDLGHVLIHKREEGGGNCGQYSARKWAKLYKGWTIGRGRSGGI